MRVGLIARRLSGQPLGVARYIEYLLKYWAEQLEADEEVVLISPEPLDLNGRSLKLRTRVQGPNLSGAAWENLVVPRAARDVDVLFGPSYTIPLTYGGRSVVAIHSMNEIESGTHPWWYRLTYSPMYRACARRAARVIVPSHSTLEDIQALYGLPREKLVVVPQGADDAFHPIDDPSVLAAARLRWLGADRPFLVFVGKLSQRRNIARLIGAFAQVKHEQGIPHALLLLGPNHLNLPLAEIAAQAGVAGDVIQNDGKISSHAELAAVYSAADLYVTASLYEGFSLTLAEALACGTPVVASNRGALGEIAGNAAVLVDDPTREDEIASAIWRVLSDDDLRQELRRRGPERARMFRIEETARQTLEVIRGVAAP